MWRSTRARWWPTAVVLGAMLGCAGPSKFSDRDINHYGKKTFAAPYDKVFPAAKDAIEILGYTAVSADMASGRIVTNRREVDRVVGEDGQYHTIYRQYEIKLAQVRDEIQLVVWPSLYWDSRQVRYDEELWSLADERAFWDKYFAEVARLASYD